MQTILPILFYSRDSLQQCPQFAPMSLLQIPATREKYAHGPTYQRGQKRDKELTKSASVIDPADLLSPTRHQHSMNDERDNIHQDAVLQKQLSSLGSEQTPGAGRSHCLSQSIGTDTRVVCTVQCAESTPVRTRTGVVQAQPSRLRQYFARPLIHAAAGAKVKAQRQKRRARLNHIAVVECSTVNVESFLSSLSLFRRVSICVCGVNIFS